MMTPPIRGVLRVVRLLLLGILVGALLRSDPALHGQAIHGTLVDAGNGVPVDGAAVVLLDAVDAQVTWRLTDPSGRFAFALDGPGTFRLRADRIGHASVLSDPLVVGAGQTILYRLEIPVEAIVLAGLRVESGRRCQVRPGSGEATARVWEEARKALEATAQTTRRGFYRYLTRRFERELDAQGERVLKEESRFDRRLTTNPWKSLDVDDLLSGGFVRTDGDGTAYYAPDADVLLSDPFLDTHCMRLIEGEDESEGLIGLGFEPVEDRGITEISGTLWVDRSTGQLRWLDYGYEELNVPNRERLGGRVGFERLPNGTWIVRDWTIRMPLLAATRTTRGGLRTELIGIKEEGGIIVRVTDVQGEIVLDSRSGILEGMVLDSTGSTPVAGVAVHLDGSGEATTDEAGRFRFTEVPEGNYDLTVPNSALDALGIGSPATLVESIPGEVTSVQMQVRGVISALTEVCGPHEPREGGGIITGRVSHESGAPAPGTHILIRWQDIRARQTGLLGQDMEARVTVDRADGRYAVCGMPRDKWLEVVLVWAGEESDPVRWRFPGMSLVAEMDVTVPGGG